MKMNNDLIKRFEAKKFELQETGELASAIDYDDQGQWVGLILAKNFAYTDLEDQIHWATSVNY